MRGSGSSFRREGFVEALGRRLARGRALADEITADVVPVPPEGDSK
jgi:hypothetical protein